MTGILGLFVIFSVGMALTASLIVAWMLLLSYGKKKLDDMDGEDWEIYFQKIPVWGYVVRGLLYLVLALWVSVPIVYAALSLFRYPYKETLTLVFALITAMTVLLRAVFKRKMLLEKIRALKGLHN